MLQAWLTERMRWGIALFMLRHFFFLFLLFLIPAAEAFAWQDKSGRQIIDKFDEIIDAVKHDETDVVENRLRRILDESSITLAGFQPFETFIDGGTPQDDPEYLMHLNGWLKKQPVAISPLLLRAEYDYKHAWFVRGNHYAVQVSYDKMREFSRDMLVAADDVAKAIRTGGANPYIRLLQLRIAKNNSGDTQRLFEEAIKDYPDFYSLYAERLTQLTSRWGGSVQAMIAFTERYSNGLAEGSSLHVLPVLLYKQLVQDMDFNCIIYPLDKQKYCVLRYNAFLTSPQMERWLDGAFGFYAHADPETFNRVVVLSLLNSKALYKPPYDRIIHIAAKSLSDDYAFNVNYGNFYFENGDDAQAADYYAKAMKEIAVFPFSSEEERAGWNAEVAAQQAKTQAVSPGAAAFRRNQ